MPNNKDMNRLAGSHQAVSFHFAQFPAHLRLIYLILALVEKRSESTD
jgi:hypothetical protein